MKKSYCKYLFSLLLFGSNGIVASRISLSSYEIVFFRTLIGSALLLALFLLTRQRFTFIRKKRDLLFVAGSGAAMVFPAILLLCAQGSAFTDSAFECFSAIGTVGLSVGITSSLAPASKLAVILLMYFGRVGSLTVFLAVTKKERPAGLRNPVGAVIVG